MSDHSSIPRWPTQAPAVDPSGRSFGVVAPAQCSVADYWVDQIAEFGRPCWRVGPGDLGAALATATVGLRVLVSGPEHVVTALGAVCRDAGLLDDEITLHATGVDGCRIYCVHCRSNNIVDAKVGSIAPCPACGRGLHVYEHFSRHAASYLGFQADAESLP